MSEDTRKNILDYIDTEYERLKQTEKERFGAPILRIEENKVYDLTVKLEEWRRVNTRFGERIAIPVTYEGNDYVIMTNPNGSLYRALIHALKSAKMGVNPEDLLGFNVVLKRSGNRYTVIAEPIVKGQGKKGRKQYQ